MNRFEPQSLSALGAIYHMHDAARALYYVLHSLQHRGQDAAGMACTDGERVVCEKNNGMLSEIFQEGVLAELNGCSALGHVRLASAQDRDLENVQPIVVRAHQGHFAIAHGHDSKRGGAAGRDGSGWIDFPRRKRRGADRAFDPVLSGSFV